MTPTNPVVQDRYKDTLDKTVFFQQVEYNYQSWTVELDAGERPHVHNSKWMKKYMKTWPVKNVRNHTKPYETIMKPNETTHKIYETVQIRYETDPVPFAGI